MESAGEEVEGSGEGRRVGLTLSEGDLSLQGGTYACPSGKSLQSLSKEEKDPAK